MMCKFVDGKIGWAVGDHGVIWHTENGGQSWELVPSPVDCPLRSICFLTDRVGWIAGGGTTPYTRLSFGVVLFTSDGGKSWQVMARDTVPTLTYVKFFGLKQGVAVGEADAGTSHRNPVHRRRRQNLAADPWRSALRLANGGIPAARSRHRRGAKRTGQSRRRRTAAGVAIGNRPPQEHPRRPPEPRRRRLARGRRRAVDANRKRRRVLASARRQAAPSRPEHDRLPGRRHSGNARLDRRKSRQRGLAFARQRPDLAKAIHRDNRCRFPR